MRRWLLLVLFWSWLSTGLVVGLGNLALVCVAAAIAAFVGYNWGEKVPVKFWPLNNEPAVLDWPVGFIALFFFRAPYGRHYRKGWEPALPNRLSWVIMESPSVLVMMLLLRPG